MRADLATSTISTGFVIACPWMQRLPEPPRTTSTSTSDPRSTTESIVIENPVLGLLPMLATTTMFRLKSIWGAGRTSGAPVIASVHTFRNVAESPATARIEYGKPEFGVRSRCRSESPGAIAAGPRPPNTCAECDGPLPPRNTRSRVTAVGARSVAIIVLSRPSPSARL